MEGTNRVVWRKSDERLSVVGMLVFIAPTLLYILAGLFLVWPGIIPESDLIIPTWIDGVPPLLQPYIFWPSYICMLVGFAICMIAVVRAKRYTKALQKAQQAQQTPPATA